MLKVFYAHCKEIYNTPQENRDIELLEALGFEVINPNTFENGEGYAVAGIDFSLSLIKKADILAFRALPSGKITSGVAKEIAWARGEGLDRAVQKPVIELPSLPPLREVLSMSATRQYLREIGQR